MSLNPFNRLGRTFSFRLNFWYASVFSISACALFFFFTCCSPVAMGRKDREVIDAQTAREYSAVYRTGGLRGLSNLIQANQGLKKDKPFFVRIVHPAAACCFKACRRIGSPSTLAALISADWKSTPPIVRIPKDEERDFTLVATVLFDGSELQVGRSTNNRDDRASSLFAARSSL